ncbi:utp25, u3 small nucleolar RNA-associated SSU processome protein 25 domain-containing protein [Ditylenchus destructor]|nr:utp25, u3 small nucleolar RNA-associated SSU processome protein 25 domain-containing protein [Ditylenchus destructor]
MKRLPIEGIDANNTSKDTSSPKKKKLPNESKDFFVEHFCHQNCNPDFVEQLKSGQMEKKILFKIPAFKKFTSYCIKRAFKEDINLHESTLPLENFSIQSKLLSNFKQMSKCNPPLWNELYQIIGRYVDLCFVSEKDLTPLICLHALNHISRTRHLVIRNNQLLETSHAKGQVNDDIIEKCRDQGLARPKVLILCPFRKHAEVIVKTMIKLIFGSDDKPFVSNLSKFNDEFGDDGNRIHEKRDVSQEFKELMSGNVDDCFRIGIGLAKKALKLYTNFEESDILLCSPLGLRMIIGDETEKKREYDFLASIEVMVVTHAHILFMQNWDHMTNIFQTLNTIPNKIKADISRVRQWDLNDHSKYYRQTLVFSEINSVEIQALFSRFCRNFAGQYSITRNQKSSLEQIQIPIIQGFFRFDYDKPEKQSDARFNFFINEVLPNCKTQTLVFISSYFDFILNLCSILQMNLFFRGEKRLMLLTERFHFYYRAKLKGIKSVVFYQLPANPQFFTEILNMAQPETKLVSQVLYCEFDVLRMQNIFGIAESKDFFDKDVKYRALLGE